MYHACPGGKTWEDIDKCLRKHGKLHVVRTLADARLVRLDQLENQEWVDAGLYLYAESKGAWKIAGAFFGRGTDYELLDLKPLVVGTHRGFRVDLGQASSLWVQLDGITPMRAVRRAMLTMYCSRERRACTTATRTCEVLVGGRAYWTFHGTERIRGHEIAIEGDRRHAGSWCAQAERVFLGWPQR